MGDIADWVLEGGLCEGCGVYMGDGPGYTQRCGSCEPSNRPRSRKRPAKQVPASPKTKTKRTCFKCKKLLPKKEMTLHPHMGSGIWLCTPCEPDAKSDALQSELDRRIIGMGGTGDDDMSDFGDQ